MSWLFVLIAWTLVSLFVSPLIGRVLADGRAVQPRELPNSSLHSPVPTPAHFA